MARKSTGFTSNESVLGARQGSFLLSAMYKTALQGYPGASRPVGTSGGGLYLHFAIRLHGKVLTVAGQLPYVYVA
jgi:hypothetical protein